MKVVINGKENYVPDILFQDGTYKSAADYVKRMNRLEEKVTKDKAAKRRSR